MTNVTLMAHNAPAGQPLLNTGWVRDADEPVVHAAAHYVSTSAAARLHLFRSVHGLWTIAPEVGSAIAYAVARSPAAHPNTVRAGEWHVPTRPHGAWKVAADFCLRAEGPNSEAEPYNLEDVGVDLFLRKNMTKLVWFVDPATGATVHSGAKAAGAAKKPGKRYCSLCRQCFSANNFVSQHLKNLHTPPPPTPPTCASDGAGSLELKWRVDACPPGAVPVGFALEFSVDDGATWERAVDDTGTPEARARVAIASLRPNAPHRFRVAVVTLVSVGAFSAASAPFQPPPASPAEGLPLAPASLAGGLAGGGTLEEPSWAECSQMGAAVDAHTPPISPPPTPELAPSAGGTSLPITGKRAHSEAGVPPPLPPMPPLPSGDSGRSDGLMWSLEDILQDVTSVTSSPIHDSLASSPRASTDGVEASPAAEEPSLHHPRNASTDDEGGEGGGGGGGKRACRREASDDMLQSLLASFADAPQLPIYRSVSATAAAPAEAPGGWGSRPGSISTPPSKGGDSATVTAQRKSGSASPPPSEGALAQTRLLRLREALRQMPASETRRLLSADVLTKLGGGANGDVTKLSGTSARTLVLLLTHASPAAAAKATSSLRNVPEELRRPGGQPPPCRVPRAPPGASVVALPPPKRRGTLARMLGGHGGVPIVALAFIALAALAMCFSALTLRPPAVELLPSPAAARGGWRRGRGSAPACHWSWTAGGCAPSNEATGACALRPSLSAVLGETAVCEPQ